MRRVFGKGFPAVALYFGMLGVVMGLTVLECPLMPQLMQVQAADEDGETDWSSLEEPPDLRPQPNVSPVEQNAALAPKAAASQPLQKKRFGLFKPRQKKPTGKKTEGKKVKSVDTEKIVNVGPRELAAANSPLLRIARSCQCGLSVLQPGFYLAKPEATSPLTRQLQILRENRPLCTVEVSHSGEPAQQGPVESLLVPANKLTIRLETQLSSDQQQLTIRLCEGETCFESLPLPVIQDSRPLISP